MGFFGGSWLQCLLFLLCISFANCQGVLAQNGRKFQLPQGKTLKDIGLNEFYIKLSTSSGSTSETSLGEGSLLTPTSLVQHTHVQRVLSLDPGSHLLSLSPQPGSRYLSNLYKVTIKGGNIETILDSLLQYQNVEYVEPVFREELFLIPNDPDAKPENNKQAYLSSVRAYDAWNITTGDSTIVIGIVDTGVEFTHDDLAANLVTNLADPIDGIDNDGNGYVDDFRGWDFANSDNNPIADGNGHGTHVTGLAAARTNNSLGMAGAGYSAKYLPLKAFKTADNTSFGTYEAIIYAANRGVDVLNLSWGSAGTYSQAAQDIINYAVLEKNVVVVAAAGNTDAELTFYPASYDNVLSVAASTLDGTKASFATYGYYVDLVAPGAAVYSTRNGNSYGSDNGSSFAAPLVSGAAALLRSRFPSYSAVQIMEQLRVTADPVDNLPGNAAYKGLMGKGTLNMYRALTDTILPSVRITKDSLFSQAGQRAFYGDTIHLALQATNWLRPASGLEIALQPLGQYASLLQGEWTEPALATFDTTSASISLLLDENTPPATRIVVKANVSATGYSDFQYFEFLTEPDTAGLQTPNLSLTISSDGDLGYTKDSLRAGRGLRFKGAKILSQAGFLIGSGKDHIANNVIDNFEHSSRNDSFSVSKHLKFFSEAPASEYYENAFWAEISDGQTMLIEQKNMSWDTDADSNFFITEYRITNTSPDAIPELYAGLFANWELAEPANNHTQWIDSLNLGLSYNHDNTYFAGIALLSTHSPTFYAADLGSSNGNAAEIGTAFPDSVKYAWLSSEFIKTSAGTNGAGNNTAQMNGVNIGELPGHSSEKIAFAWVAASTKQEIVAAVQQARKRYKTAKEAPRTHATVYACKDEPTVIDPPKGELWKFYNSPNGEGEPLFEGAGYPMPALTQPADLYIRNADSAYLGDVYKLRVLIDPVSSEFEVSEDTVLLEPGKNAVLKFASKGQNASWYAWDFGNGFESTIEKPEIVFNKPGAYTVTHTVTSAAGCKSATAKQIIVANKAPLPDISPQLVCAGEEALLQASNATTIRVYASPDLEKKVFEGSIFTTEPLFQDMVYYVTNADSLFESGAVEVEVKMNTPDVRFEYVPDTTTLENRILLINPTAGSVTVEWKMDGLVVSEKDTLPLELTGTEIREVVLSVTNGSGCTGEVSRTITPEKSLTPVIASIKVCPGDSIRLRPENGNYFLFYTGQSNTPAHKGKSFLIDRVSDTVEVSVRGIDKLLESDPAQLTIAPYDFAAAFRLEPEKLILAKQQTVRFIDESRGATSWQWWINGKLVETDQNPRLAFDSAGTYKVELIIKNNPGCIAAASRELRVLEVTSVASEKEDGIVLFPNPSSGLVTVFTGNAADALGVVIFNAAGQKVSEKMFSTPAGEGQISLDCRALPPGSYIVQLLGEGAPIQKRLIIQ